MINEYRTLLLDLTDEGNPDEYISPGFLSLNLPPALQAFYNLLFPTNTSRYYAQFLAYCYLQTLRAANQEQFVYSLDKRLTYKLNEITDYFLINNVSQPIISNFQYPIAVFGMYTVNSSTSANYEDILISQQSGIYISVYSKTNKVYYNSNSSSPTLTADYLIQLTSNISSNISNTITVDGTGLSFIISGNFSDLVSTSNTTWEFTAQAPFNFDFSTFFNSLLSNRITINNMLNYDSSVNDTNSLNIWNMHYNPVYRFAGLLNCYILQVNNLLN